MNTPSPLANKGSVKSFYNAGSLTQRLTPDEQFSYKRMYGARANKHRGAKKSPKVEPIFARRTYPTSARLPLILISERRQLVKQITAFNQHLSLPSLQSKDRVWLLRAQQEKDVRTAKIRMKHEKAMRVKQRKWERRMAREQRRQEREAEVERIYRMQEAAASVIQRAVRNKETFAKLVLCLFQESASVKLQAHYRGYMVNRKLKKIQSAKERSSAKKILRWQAMTTIVIAIQKWIKRSRIRRWLSLLREVRAALQGFNADSLLPTAAAALAATAAARGDSREASRGTDSGGAAKPNSRSSEPEQYISNGIRITRTIVSKQSVRGGNHRNNRRQSCVSAIAGVQQSTLIQGKKGNVQRISIVNTDDVNTLSIEIMHIASGTLITVEVGFLMWAVMGMGGTSLKPEQLSEEQRAPIHRMLLDYCLMQTGQTKTGIGIFDKVPSLSDIFETVGMVEPKPRFLSLRRASGSAEMDFANARRPKNMREFFSEGLRMTFVKRGTVLYEQGMLGTQMFFIRSGKVEFLTYHGSTEEDEEEMLVGQQANDIQTFIKLKLRDHQQGKNFTFKTQRDSNDRKSSSIGLMMKKASLAPVDSAGDGSDADAAGDGAKDDKGDGDELSPEEEEALIQDVEENYKVVAAMGSGGQVRWPCTHTSGEVWHDHTLRWHDHAFIHSHCMRWHDHAFIRSYCIYGMCLHSKLFAPLPATCSPTLLYTRLFQFGELGMLQGEHGSPRLATVVAVEDVQLFSLHAKDVAAMAENAQSEAVFWNVMEGNIHQWLRGVDEGQCENTPDLEVLRKLVGARAGNKVQRTQSFLVRTQRDQAEEFKNRNLYLKHNVSPIAKLRRCVRVVMISARWKRLAGVVVAIHMSQGVSLVEGLRKSSITDLGECYSECYNEWCTAYNLYSYSTLCYVNCEYIKTST
jgi:CRP-like cAMP-binding protein